MFTELISEETNTHQVTDNFETKDFKFDIDIEKVVCSFNVQIDLNLKDIATVANNAEYQKENHKVVIKMDNPILTANSSGKITCVGAKSEKEAQISTRHLEQFVQRIQGQSWQTGFFELALRDRNIKARFF